MSATCATSSRASTASRLSVVPFGAAALASLAVVGADARWLAAVGKLVAHGHVPSSLPFASAPTSGWHDVPALAELVFRAMSTFGDRGYVLLQVVAVFVAFALLVAGTRRGLAAAVVLLGSLANIVVVRAELFSLTLFPLLLLLLHRRQRLWLAVPLIAVWSNLHGSVLVGLAVLAIYVAFERRDMWWVVPASMVAACATPVLWHTPQYYWAVSQNEAARRGVGLWAPLGFHFFDGLLVAAAAFLIVRAGRAWRPWEAVAALVLAAATVHSARLGVWFLFLAAYPAARRMADARSLRFAGVFAVVAGAMAVVGIALYRVPPGGRIVARAAATHQPVLAEPILAEQLELAGGRVWVADPIDAFRRRDQALYLDWLDGHGDAAVVHARYVLVNPGSVSGRRAARDPRLRLVERVDAVALYRRR